MIDIKINMHIVNRIDDVGVNIHNLDLLGDELINQIIPQENKHFKYYLTIEDKLSGVRIEKKTLNEVIMCTDIY